MSLIDTVRAEVQRAASRLRGVVRRGLLSSAVTVAGKVGITGSYSEDCDPEIDYWQTFGVASRPPAGGGAIFVSPDGTGERAVVVASYDQAHRPTDLEASEVVIYGANGNGQAQVRLKSNGDVVVIPGASGKVLIGDDAATEFAVLGTALKSALQAFATECGSAVVEPKLKSAAIALSTALASILSAKVKVG